MPTNDKPTTDTPTNDERSKYNNPLTSLNNTNNNNEWFERYNHWHTQQHPLRAYTSRIESERQRVEVRKGKIASGQECEKSNREKNKNKAWHREHDILTAEGYVQGASKEDKRGASLDSIRNLSAPFTRDDLYALVWYLL